MTTKTKYALAIALISAFIAYGTQAKNETAKKEQTKKEASQEPVNEEVQNAEYKTMVLATGAKVTWIKDNPDDKKNSRNVFSDASDSLYNSLGLAEGIPASVSTFLLNVDSTYILFDAGLGSFGGQTSRHLNELGINPDDIKLVYLTHLHVDHISGLMNKSEKGFEKVFKNAAIYVGKVERDAWMNDIEKNDLQKGILGVYNDSLHLFNFGDTLPHNVEAIDAIGHTPGHTVFRYNELLVIGDLMHGYALQINHPEINSNFDMDKEKSIESRKRILEYAKANKLTMAGMHAPAPGFVNE